MDIIKLASSFRIPSTPVSYEENKTGHINSTFFITCADGSRYVLQKINTSVFKDPEGLMRNAVAVTRHIIERTEKAGGDTSRCTLRFIPVDAPEGDRYCLSDEGGTWRMYAMIENAFSRQLSDSPEEFREVGRAFGRFQMLLSDFDASGLVETIPRFHDTANRYDNLLASIEKDAAGRAGGVLSEIEFVKARKDVCSFILKGIRDGSFPLRVTHNDTKLNNILLDSATGKPVCVIDLDTVMPGSVLYDFGDAIRFGAATAAEDETDLSLVGVDTKLFDAFVRGFTEGLEGSLTDAEIRAFPMGAVVITLETGIRFLTDYRDGDVYFRTEYPQHNLDRARNQFAIVADLERKMPELERIVAAYLK